MASLRWGEVGVVWEGVGGVVVLLAAGDGRRRAGEGREGVGGGDTVFCGVCHFLWCMLWAVGLRCVDVGGFHRGRGDLALSHGIAEQRQFCRADGDF